MYEINEKSDEKNTETKQAKELATQFANAAVYEINEKRIGNKNQEVQQTQGVAT
jgi:hypothetical protein